MCKGVKIIEIIGYGEDALTLWAIKNRLNDILAKLDDHSDITKCKVFFRPSFGRSGGANSSQFGEFDFIILSEEYLYLGESKWDRSSENKDGILELRDEQKLRHEIFRYYIEEWVSGDFPNWYSFLQKAEEDIKRKKFIKPLAPEKSLLSTNLQTILQIIKSHFSSPPKTRNVLLYLHGGESTNLPKRVSDGFELILIDYSPDKLDNFIRIEL